MNLAGLKLAEGTARTDYESAKSALAHTIRMEIEAATAQIKAAHEEESKNVSALEHAYYAAKKAREDGEIAAAQTTVFKQKDGLQFRVGDEVKHTVSKKLPNHYRYENVEVFGIVEIMSRENQYDFPARRYRKPNLGELYVRLRKADGTLGKQWEPMLQYPQNYWKLVEPKLKSKSLEG